MRRFKVRVNGKEFIVEVEEIREGRPRRRGVRIKVPEAAPPSGPSRSREEGPSGLVRSPLVGRVLRILVSEGQQVSAGQPLLVLESMKMENEIVSPRDGTVKKIMVTEGETVERGEPLIEVG